MTTEDFADFMKEDYTQKLNLPMNVESKVKILRIDKDKSKDKKYHFIVEYNGGEYTIEIGGHSGMGSVFQSAIRNGSMEVYITIKKNGTSRRWEARTIDKQVVAPKIEEVKPQEDITEKAKKIQQLAKDNGWGKKS